MNATFVPAGTTPARFDLSGAVASRGRMRFGPVELPPRGFSIEILFEVLALSDGDVTIVDGNSGDPVKLRVDGGVFAMEEVIQGRVTSSANAGVGIHHVIMVYEDDDTYSLYDRGAQVLNHQAPPSRGGLSGRGVKMGFEPFSSGPDLRFFRMRVHGSALTAAEVDAKCNELRAGFNSPFTCN